MNRPILFDDFRPGEALGDDVQTYDTALIERWRRIYGPDPADGAGGPAEAASLTMVMMMRAFLAVVAPRPPGNIHARQRFALCSLPRTGEAIVSRIVCASREIRRERRYVDLAMTGHGEDGRLVYDATLTLIWAA